MERDVLTFDDLSLTIDFNSHAHVERDAVVCKGFEQAQDFNSHAHVERDVTELHAAGIDIISTHTLTWSVTVHSTCRK